ncbi:MAG TPA: hypothetical protein VHS31_10800 [Tepidisphaeraceae bacterium]|jgi:Flp pilus assembly protein TadD|nr:hypothetical protein [Tepidisphaeraceae bacterium]
MPPNPKSAIQNPKSGYAPAILLAALVLLTVGRVCVNEFAGWDDPENISANPHYDPPTIRGIAHFWAGPTTGMYIPLPYTMWGGLAYVARLAEPDPSGSRLNPWVYHTANLLIHLATSLLVLDFLNRITKQRWAAWFGAAVFAIHPLQVETVAWATGARDLLCVLFIAAGINLLARENLRNAKWIYFAAALATVLACLSKTTGVITPALLLVIDVRILHTPWRRALAGLSASFVIAFGFCILGMLVQPPIMEHLAPIWARPLIATDAMTFYLSKLFWPLKLCMDYGRTPDVAIQSRWFFYSWIVPLLAAIIIWFNRRRVPFLVAGALIALIGIAPVLGIVSFNFQAYSTVADHYFYPSMLGIAIIIASILEQSRARWMSAAAIAAVLAMSVISLIDAGYWQNVQSLAHHTLEVNPRSFAAYTNLGVDMAHHGDRDGAIEAYQHAIAANPDYGFAHLDLGMLLLDRGDATGAAKEFHELLRIYASQRNADLRLASNVAGVIAKKLARQNQYQDAVDMLSDALNRDPSNEQVAAELEEMRTHVPTTQN